MQAPSSLTSLWLNRFFSVLAVFGIGITVVGIGLDLLPGTSPGVSVPQLMMIIGGGVLFGTGILLRHPIRRQSLIHNVLKNLTIVVVMVGVTIILLELIMSVAGLPTRYPTDVPDTFLTAVPWWTCDEAGCHYVYDAMNKACNNKDISGRRCMVNRQGFHDSQDFVMQDMNEDSLRVLMLGDSFTFGGTADIGQSFAETIETNLPDAIVWNTGIPGAGTNQAIDTARVYAPILKPQVAILGFYMNDYDDNLLPVESYFMGVNADNFPLAIRQYVIDDYGNVTSLTEQSQLYYLYQETTPPTSELERIFGITRVGSLILNTRDAIGQIISKTDGTKLAKQVAVTREYLAQLRDYLDEQNIEFLILLIPARNDIAEPSPLFQSAIQLFEDLDITYLNPRQDLSAEIDYATIPDIHWSTTGHVKVGEMLTDCLNTYLVDGTITTCEHVISPSP